MHQPLADRTTEEGSVHENWGGPPPSLQQQVSAIPVPRVSSPGTPATKSMSARTQADLSTTNLVRPKLRPVLRASAGTNLRYTYILEIVVRNACIAAGGEPSGGEVQVRADRSAFVPERPRLLLSEASEPYRCIVTEHMDEQGRRTE